MISTRSLQLFNYLLRRSSFLSKECQQRELFNMKLISHINLRLYSKKESKKEYFDTALTLHTFDEKETKSKDTYLEVLRKYESQPGRKTDRVQFIYAALKYMEEFGVEKDLECYKSLMDVFPKGKMIPTNIFQAEFMHYPKEQKCATYILEKLEENGITPDVEMEKMLYNIFGKDSIPIHKFWRIMYWFPKFKNISPWPLPKPLPNDALEMAKLAIKKMSSVDPQAEITVYETDTVEDSVDKTWIVSAITPTQKKLLEDHQPRTKAVYVEGPFTFWLRNKTIDYFVLLTKIPKSDIYKPPRIDTDDITNLQASYWDLRKTTVIKYPSVHEQMHETIFAVCATGTSSKDSVLSWIRCLQKENPVLSELHIVFTLKQKTKEDIKYLEASSKPQINKDQQKEIDAR